MVTWFKRLFGFAEEVVTLADRHAKASKLASDALNTFNWVAQDLERAAGQLHELSAEAHIEAAALTERATQAAGEAEKNLARAAKIRALLD